MTDRQLGSPGVACDDGRPFGLTKTTQLRLLHRTYIISHARNVRVVAVVDAGTNAVLSEVSQAANLLDSLGWTPNRSVGVGS